MKKLKKLFYKYKVAFFLLLLLVLPIGTTFAKIWELHLRNYGY
jgi:hypothetical protein